MARPAYGSREYCRQVAGGHRLEEPLEIHPGDKPYYVVCVRCDARLTIRVGITEEEGEDHG